MLHTVLGKWNLTRVLLVMVPIHIHVSGFRRSVCSRYLFVD